MAGTRTAPTVDGTGTFKSVSVRMIDASGDVRTVTVDVLAATTDAQIEAYVAGLQAISNASVYAVSVGVVYNSVEDSSNAQSEPKSESVAANLVINAGNASKLSKAGYVPAPEAAIFITGTDDIDPTSAALVTYLTAFLAMVNEGVAMGSEYEIKSARYTERRQINSAIKF